MLGNRTSTLFPILSVSVLIPCSGSDNCEPPNKNTKRRKEASEWITGISEGEQVM